ncbi:hypothetical protein EV715DRAFT_177590, partial [Schizophyllum commune]
WDHQPKTRMQGIDSSDGPALPPELIGLIVDDLHASEDFDSLKRCALALRNMRTQIQQCLFSRIRLRLPVEYAAAREDPSALTAPQRLLEVLRATPRLADYVRDLVLEFMLVRGPHYVTNTDDSILHILPLLRNVESLEIRSEGAAMLRPPDSIIMALVLPSLTSLRLSSIVFPLATIEKMPGLRHLACYNALSDDELDLLASPRVYQHPRVEHLELASSRNTALLYPSFLIQTPSSFHHLVRLDVSRMHSHRPEINRILQICKGTLCHLDMICPGTPTNGDRQDLSMLCSLRRLGIHRMYLFLGSFEWLRDTLATVSTSHVQLELAFLEEDDAVVNDSVDIYESVSIQSQRFSLLDEAISGVEGRFNAVHIDIQVEIDPNITETGCTMYNCAAATRLVHELLPRTKRCSRLSVAIDGL